MSNAVLIVAGFGGAIVLSFLLAIMLRRVVPTNEVHIVQSSKKTVSYGKEYENGNTYYHWPSWVPKIGVVVVQLPVSVFGQDLTDYEAYDKGRLPFIVDVKAFFRITDSNIAAQRVSSFPELMSQLKDILRGAIRTILASYEIEEIMQGRSQFGDAFTKEVNDQLTQWGVATVKNIELMDLRDSQGSQVIKNIMEKKKSMIEMESRIEVARNLKDAQLAEITASQETQIREQDAAQAVGVRKAEVEQKVGIATQQSTQAVKEQEKVTADKEMQVIQVREVRAAEITKEVQIIEANQLRETTILTAEGDLSAKKLESEGIQVEGLAKAEAEKAMQLAPIQAQIVLAKEIGGNAGYQQYLISIKQVEAGQAVGTEQARSLAAADLKIIANGGNVVEGVTNIMDILSTKGGTQIGAMLEALSQSGAGASLLTRLSGSNSSSSETVSAHSRSLDTPVFGKDSTKSDKRLHEETDNLEKALESAEKL